MIDKKNIKVKFSLKEEFDHNKFKLFEPLISNKAKLFGANEKGLFEVLNYSTVYTFKKKKLVFIGAIHVGWWGEPIAKRSWFFDLLKEILDWEKPDKILVEEPFDLVGSDLIKENAPKEIAWTVKYAIKNNISVNGMDAPKDMWKKYLREKGFEDFLIFYYVHWEYRAQIKKGRSEFSALDYAYSKVAHEESKSVDLIKLICQDASKKYTGLKFEESLKTKGLFIPFPHSDKYPTNRIKGLINDIRNQCMIDRNILALKNNNSVFAMAGHGHIRTFREELNSALSDSFGSVQEKRLIEIINDFM